MSHVPHRAIVPIISEGQETVDVGISWSSDPGGKS
jgi:hypothetical protein